MFFIDTYFVYLRITSFIKFMYLVQMTLQCPANAEFHGNYGYESENLDPQFQKQNI